jgi:ribosomal protein L21E
MAFKWYHGKTGVVWNVTKRAVGVEVNKTVRVSAEALGLWGWDRRRAQVG